MLATSAGAATVSSNAIGYALGGNGDTLVTIANLNTPGVATGTALTASGGGAISLSALAYRPQTDQLYGYSNQDGTVYLVDTITGVATAQASLPGGTDVETLGFDFNNQVDAARIVTTNNDNLVFFPNNTPQNIAQFTDLFYDIGDANEGDDPEVIGNAYTNAVPNATTTQQFGIDSQTDSLITIANNAGTLATVGRFTLNGDPIDILSDGGFDILSFSEGDNTALALLNVFGPLGSMQALFTFSLMADMGAVDLALVGTGGTPTSFGSLDGFAVAPVAAVPLPASLGLLFGGIALMGFVGRKRRTA